jgi:ParB-like chromosome segregation protein Spo0J
MPQDRFDELVEDIAKNGLIRQIVIFEGKILDGRHRYRACIAAGVAPRFTPFLGTIEEAYSLVVAENLRRRDLTPEQRLDVAAKLVAILREKAKEGQGTRTDLLANLPKGSPEPPEPAANVVPFEPKHTHVELAKAAGVSPRTAQDALTIKERGTAEDWQAVVDGKASVSGKAREVRQREKPKADIEIATEAPKRRKESPAEAKAVVEAMDSDPQAFRDTLRIMLDFEQAHDVAALLNDVFSHRSGFALYVAEALHEMAQLKSKKERR